MARAMSARGRESDPVAVADPCPECGSAQTVTSAFAAGAADDLPKFSAWCEACGHGFAADDLADDVDRGRGVATDGGRQLSERGRVDEPVPVDGDCPECGSDETLTSAFAAAVADELSHLSAWCVACGHGFAADAVAKSADVERGRGVATDGGREQCAECGGYLPDEIEPGTGVYCPECGTGQLVTDGGRALAREERAREPDAPDAGAYAYAVEDPRCDSCDEPSDDLAVTPAGLFCESCAADVAREAGR